VREIRELSDKQALLLGWWCDTSPWRDRDGILCDGAVRSGKTTWLALSFFFWAMGRFDGESFAVCGVSAKAVGRNVVSPLLPLLRGLGFQVREKVSEGTLTVRFGKRANKFYLFGGGDVRGEEAIRGMTLAGTFLDEVTLLEREFVEQAAARCSTPGAKVWMTCNPDSPEHWFYKDWVLRCEERNLLRVRFAMTDNPGLDRETLERYARTFRGSFYRRFVLGEWTAPAGRVYDFFDESWVRPAPREEMERWRVSCDYGTRNPTSMGLWGLREGVWYRVREFYYDARKEGRMRTDADYVRDLEGLCGALPVERVIVDPSAASFLAALREGGWPAAEGDNRVLPGIRRTAQLLREGRLVICEGCVNAIREFSLYRWDSKAAGDRVMKRDDHAMDDIRYFAMDLARGGPVRAGMTVEREVRSW